MSGCKYRICLLIVLVSLFSIQAFSQGINFSHSLALPNSEKVNLKPQLHYSGWSTLSVIPHSGTVTGFAISPFLSVPLTPKLSVNGGIIGGHYFSGLRNLNTEGEMNGVFNELSVYGSAVYHLNPQFSVYGTAIKQITGTTPFYFLPESSYTIGSTINFGSFSIGVAMQMSNWNDNFSPSPFDSSQGFYSPFIQRPGIFSPIGR